MLPGLGYRLHAWTGHYRPGILAAVAAEGPFVSVTLSEGKQLTAAELAKLVIAHRQLEEGRVITPDVIRGLDAKDGNIEQKAKRIRSLARGREIP